MGQVAMEQMQKSGLWESKDPVAQALRSVVCRLLAVNLLHCV
jgi:hypothetical protein